jgi:hypothetical protein
MKIVPKYAKYALGLSLLLKLAECFSRQSNEGIKPN